MLGRSRFPRSEPFPSTDAPPQPRRSIWLDGARLVLVKAAIVVVSIESEPSQLVKKSSPDQTASHCKTPPICLLHPLAASTRHLCRLSPSIRSCLARYHRDLARSSVTYGVLCLALPYSALLYAAPTSYCLQARNVLGLSSSVFTNTSIFSVLCNRYVLAEPPAFTARQILTSFF